MNKLPSYRPFVVPVINHGRVAITVPPFPPKHWQASPPNRKNGSYSLYHLDVHATPSSAEWRSRQSVVRMEACEKYLSGVEKRKKKKRKKQGSLLATSMIGSHVDKVRKKKQETPTIIHIQLQKNGDTATTGYWGYQGLRYRYGELTRKGSPV